MSLSRVEIAIVRALSMADLGNAPIESHMCIADRVLSHLRDEGIVKTYNLTVKQGRPLGRTMTIEWSALLEFPSQLFNVRIEDLTRESLDLFDVMLS